MTVTRRTKLALAAFPLLAFIGVLSCQPLGTGIAATVGLGLIIPATLCAWYRCKQDIRLCLSQKRLSGKPALLYNIPAGLPHLYEEEPDWITDVEKSKRRSLLWRYCIGALVMTLWGGNLGQYVVARHHWLIPLVMLGVYWWITTREEK